MDTNEISNSVENKKYNNKFLLLSALGIIFVVTGHCGRVNVFFNNVFPFYSFHMALFAFISGYFFKDRKVLAFFKHKTKRLIGTYLIWNAVYGVIVFIFKKLNLIYFGQDLSLYNIFISPFWSDSNQFEFNVAAWFVLAIYFIQLIYFLLNKVLNKLLKLKTEMVVLPISIVIAIIELNMVRNGAINSNIKYMLTRITFLMPFYVIGQIYKKVEKYDKINNIIYFSIILVVQIILLQNFKNLYYNLNILTFKYNYGVYFISSITGILFWLKISSIFEHFISNNKIIKYIGENTYTIMMNHMFIIYLFNLLMYIIHKETGLIYEFNVEKFKSSLWYLYGTSNPALILLYIVLGISIPLLIKYFMYDRFKIFILKKIKKGG